MAVVPTPSALYGDGLHGVGDGAPDFLRGLQAVALVNHLLGVGKHSVAVNGVTFDGRRRYGNHRDSPSVAGYAIL